MRWRISAAMLVVLGAISLLWTSQPARAAANPTGLHVVGDRVLNGADQQIQMIGVNFSSFEYGCLTDYFNDGPQPPNQAEINGMLSWNVHVVRIPLNEDCWLGINGINPAVAGQNYINAVTNYVNLLTSNGIASIMNLHFNAPGTHKATEQEPMADRDHANTFWTSVANTYKNNSAVMFEPYNEPHDISWSCWRDGGCVVTGSQSGEGQFTVAGMQEMVTAIRNTGATNPIIVTGNNWGSDISGWVANKPTDPLNQLIAGWHSYGDGLSCQTQACWDSTFPAVLAVAPIVATEIGQLPPQAPCAHGYIDQVMNWLDAHDAQGYTAWTWGNFSCANDPALLASSDSNFTGIPSQTYGQGYKDHLVARPQPDPTPTPTPPPPPTGWALVQQANVAHSVSPAMLVTTAATAAGDGFVIEVGANHSDFATPAVTSITDNGATHATYALAVRKTIAPPDSQDVEIWYAANIPAGITMITVNISSQGAGTVWIGEFSGLALVNPVDQTASLVKIGGTNHGTGITGTTTQANELVVAAYADAGYNTTVTSPGGWTQDLNAASHTFDQMVAIHKLGASLATYTATFTTSAGTNSAAAIATFKIQ